MPTGSYTPSSSPQQAALVYGLGFMGGSLAAALVQAGWTVYLHHRRPEVMEKAEALGYGTAVDDPLAVMPKCKIAVVCTPVSVIADHIRLLAAAEGNTVITDIGSTKSGICNALYDLSEIGRFIGSHPMAGSHLQGLEHADPQLYKGCRTAITPHSKCTGAAIAAVQAFWTSIGATCHRYSPEDHDLAVGEISHLPHILSSACAAALSPRGLALAATGFRDTSRIAAGSVDLWTEILLQNNDAVSHQLEHSIAHLQDLLKALQTADSSEIETWLQIGRDKRLAFERGNFE